ncbi:unnamed protein product [Schistosoma margrebowiei]|uniref:Uncharacterized protein n=1 Tax=Schistosoma margrebowiei TaxID=48269 RepID=A0A183M8R1_9TREM|nr:unnamed protein product [Schistosoma margrebowiei]
MKISACANLLACDDLLSSSLGVSHNNVDTTSVFIDSNMCWKLCGFELALEFKNMSSDHIRRIEALKGRQDAKVLINSCMHSLPKARIPSDHLLAHPSFK